jgi:four helix bundle protein
MEPQPKKHGSFGDLDVYKAAREFRRKMYNVAKGLPESEKYNLNSQMRRAALSLTNNIAEGHGRFHYLDNIRFVLISRGSLEELMDDLNACEDESYLPASQLLALRTDATSLMRQINGYLRYLRDSKIGASLALREEAVRYSAGNESHPLDEFEDQAPVTNHQSPITNY